MSESELVRLMETPTGMIPNEVLHKYAYSGATHAEQANHWIEVAAYYIWIDVGRPHGQHDEHWKKACQMFLERPDNQ